MSERTLVQRYGDETNKRRGRLRYARQMAWNFAIAHRLIEYETIDSGSSLPNDNIKITRCFGRYFDSWDAPQTITVDSARTYIWNFG